MVCKNCNHEIDNGAMFCTYCGTPVEQTPEPETQPVENASTEDAAQNPYENVRTAQPEVDNAQPTADSQPQQNPYSQQYGQPNQAYYQQPQPNKTSYGQQFTNSPNNDYGANQSKYGNQYQSYNNGYNQQYNTQYQQTYNSQPVPARCTAIRYSGYSACKHRRLDRRYAFNLSADCKPYYALCLGVQLINKEVAQKLCKSRSYPGSYRSCACGSCFNYTCSLRYQYLQRIFQFRILLSLNLTVNHCTKFVQTAL